MVLLWIATAPLLHEVRSSWPSHVGLGLCSRWPLAIIEVFSCVSMERAYLTRKCPQNGFWVTNLSASDRVLLEKGSFQESLFSRDSGEFAGSRVSGDSWQPPKCGKQRRIRPLSRDTRECGDLWDSLEIPPAKDTFRNDPFFRSWISFFAVCSSGDKFSKSMSPRTVHISQSACKVRVVETVVLENGRFVPRRKEAVLTKIGEHSDIAFDPQKQGILLLEPRKSTKMTKMAGVTPAKWPFAKSTVLTTLTKQTKREKDVTVSLTKNSRKAGGNVLASLGSFVLPGARNTFNSKHVVIPVNLSRMLNIPRKPPTESQKQTQPSRVLWFKGGWGIDGGWNCCFWGTPVLRYSWKHCMFRSFVQIRVLQKLQFRPPLIPSVWISHSKNPISINSWNSWCTICYLSKTHQTQRLQNPSRETNINSQTALFAIIACQSAPSHTTWLLTRIYSVI